MKKIIVVILIIFFTFLIYKTNENNLIDYVSLGDSIALGINSYGNYSFGYNKYVKSYLENNNMLHEYNPHYIKEKYKIIDLANDIKNNKSILYNNKTYNLKRDLREADLITVSIGMDELVEILDNNDLSNFGKIKLYLDEIIKNMDELINNLTGVSKSKIILIGYYNPYNKSNKDIDKMFAYINDNYYELAKKYSVNYIDIYTLISNNSSYLPNQNDYHITSKGYLKIANKIIDTLDW